MVDKSWGTGPTPLRVPSNDSPERREAERGEARGARAATRADAMAERQEARQARREADLVAREAERTQRREQEQQLAAGDPHAAAARRHRSSGRRDVVREQRDTSGYTTVVDADRIRALAKRGASVSGLAGVFGISEEEVAAALAQAE